MAKTSNKHIPNGNFGPRERHGKRRRGGPDWLKVTGLLFGIVALFFVGITSAYGYMIYREIGDVASIKVPSEVHFTLAEGVTEDPNQTITLRDTVTDRTTILLIGSDSREGLTKEQLARIGTKDAGSDLTDTIILAQVDPVLDSIALLSFPRDLVVRRCDGTRGRINEAWWIGGRQGNNAACLIDTIEKTSGIPVDHIMRVNFAGFVNVVDSLGGVDFAVDRNMRDRWSGLNIKKGCNHFDGVGAIQFVRARHIDSDFGRQARQQRFAKEMINKSLSLGVLANPVTVANTVNSISDAIQTDTEFDAAAIIDLAVSLNGMSAENMHTYSIPATPGRLGEASVLFMNEKQADKIFEAFINGEIIENVAEPKPTTDPSPVPSDWGKTPEGSEKASSTEEDPKGKEWDQSVSKPASSKPSESKSKEPKSDLPAETNFKQYAGSFDPGISC